MHREERDMRVGARSFSAGASSGAASASRASTPSLLPTAMLLALLALVALFPSAAAARPEPLIQFPGDGLAGTGAGRMQFPRAVAASPVSGDLYVSDSGNARINEFTAWGAFVRAFGWGVKSGDTAASGLDACTTASGCQAGFAGGGEPGRFGFYGYGNAIGIDSAGDVYVNDMQANHRVLKFSPTGKFLLAFGGGVLDGGAAGTGNLSAGSSLVTAVSTTSRDFAPGESLSGAGIGPDTRVVSVGAGTLTLSRPATASGAAVALSAAAPPANVPVNELQSVSLNGSPSGGTFTLTFTAGSLRDTAVAGSNQLTSTSEAHGTLRVGDPTSVRSAFGLGTFTAGSATVTKVSTSVGAFTVGAPIGFSGSSGFPVPAGTTITAVGPETLTLSHPATASLQENFTAYTTIAAIDTSSGSLTLSAKAADSASFTPSVTATETTAPIPYNASAAEVQAALEVLPATGAGNVAVSGSVGGPWTVEFKGPRLADTNVAQMSTDGSGLTPAASATVSTLTEGTGAAEACSAQEVSEGYTCSAGVPGAGDGEFRSAESGDYVTVGPDDTVYVGDRERIQEFEPDGAFKGQIAFKSLHEELPSFPEKTSALVLEADPQSGALYLIAGGNTFSNNQDSRVFRIDPTTGKLVGAPLGSPAQRRPTALATDSAGDLYVVIEGLGGFGSIVEFNASGAKLVPDAAEEEAIEKEQEAASKGEPFEPFERFGEPPEHIQLWAIATDAACEPESDDLYATYLRQRSESGPELAYVSAFGPAPQNALKCPPPPVEPPEIEAQYPTSVGTDAATLGAVIDSGYDVGTTYYVQYGTGKCSEGGCPEERPLAPGAKLTSKISAKALKSKAVFLSGLAPGATYHYRFVAENSAGTVRGVGGEVGADGAEASFTTFPAPGEPKEDCPNQAFRGGPSAKLTDCRAYELVSPAHRSPAADIVSGLSVLEFPAELNQSAADGERLAYSSRLAFGDAVGAPFISEYIATRQAGEGWSSHAISPPRESKQINDSAVFKFDIEEKAFTADLCSGWLAHNADPPLGEGAIEGFPNIYRRDNCEAGADSYEAPTSVEPSSTEAQYYWPELQGFSADGSHTVFRANGTLTAEAPDLGVGGFTGPSFGLLYEQTEGTIRYLCVLPDGTPWMAPCSAGTIDAGNSNAEGRVNQVKNAVSADGRRVYWSEDSAKHLYLRENADQAQSAIVAKKCSEPAKACSYAVSSGPASFWTAASDGSQALYTEGEKLREFNAETKTSKTIAPEGVQGVAGGSEDLSTFYFVTTMQLGGKGQKGEPNIYRRTEGAVSLVETLAKIDSEAQTLLPLSPAAVRPTGRGSRSTGDGQHLVFVSTASLGGYDNRDAQSGEPDIEVYLYDAGAAGPVCISCNPSGARPAGRALKNPGGPTRGAAALLPMAETQLYAPHAITEDGNRVFFNSFDALVSRDTNGKEDVYEWERASGQEACEELGAELFVESSGGCLSLISSGESAQDSTFVDMSIENGARDVFFKTGSSLVPEDPGLIDIYDAREGGGLPEAPPTPPGCEGEACQGTPEPPNDPTPSSESFEGAGNVHEEPVGEPRPKCAKGKIRRKGRCIVKKHHKRAHRRANHTRRAGK